MTILLAVAAVLRAVSSGRLRWLVIAMALVGTGFNIKMLEAYLALPAIAGVYFFAAPGGWRTRIRHLVIAGLVLAAVSLSWPLAVDVTPATMRPYVGSSQHNSEIELAFGYNGIQRLLGMRPSGAPAGRPSSSGEQSPVPPPPGAAAAGPFALPPPFSTDGFPGFGPPPGSLPSSSDGPARGFAPPGGGPPGFVEGFASPLRLVDRQLGGQASWLLSFALIGTVATGALTVCRRRWRLGLLLRGLQPSTQQAQLLLWGIWLLTAAAFFSVANFFHPYYLIMLAPPVAALTGMGFGLALERSRRHPRAAGWLILALVATAGTQAYLLFSYPQWNGRLTLPMLTLCGIAAACLLGRFFFSPGRISSGLLAGAAAAGLAGMLLVPAAWSVLTVMQGAGGGMPAGGPTISPFPADAPFANGVRGDANTAGPPPGPFGFAARSDQSRLLSYLSGHAAGSQFLLAVPSSMEAAPIIIRTGLPVMAMGGFSGGDPILTSMQLAADVAEQKLRFFLLPAAGVGGGFPSGAPPEPAPPPGLAPGSFADGAPGPMPGLDNAATRWVTQNCAAVPASEWQQPSNAGAGFGFGPGSQQLYDCAQTAQGS